MSDLCVLRTPEATRAFKPPRGLSHDGVGRADAPQNPGRSMEPTLTVADLDRGDLTGFRLGHYVLGQKIGAGGMGQVFVGRHETLGKLFAMKFMAEPIRASTEGTHRFQLEVESLGRLSHPNIVNAVDAGCTNGVHFLVTELVKGKDLLQVVATDGPLSEERAFEILMHVAAGLAYAHSHAFIHRDIKPSNLIVDEHGIVRILDFGLVRSQQHSTDVTCPGLLMGTIDFLSPEQAADGRMADHRSDLYSLGCTLLYLLTGKVPYCGDQFSSMPSKIHGHLFLEPPALSNGELRVSSRMQVVLARLLQKRPEDRFQSAQEVVDFLRADTALAEQSDPSRDRGVSGGDEKAKISRKYLYSFVGAGALLLVFVAGGLSQSNTQGTEAVTPSAIPNSSSTGIATTIALPGEPKQGLHPSAKADSEATPESTVQELPGVESITTAFRTAESGRVLNRMSGKFLSGKPSFEPVKNHSNGSSAEQNQK